MVLRISGPTEAAHQQRDSGPNQKQKEQYSCNAGGAHCDASETKDGSDNCDHEKDGGVIQHGVSPGPFFIEGHQCGLHGPKKHVTVAPGVLSVSSGKRCRIKLTADVSSMIRHGRFYRAATLAIALVLLTAIVAIAEIGQSGQKAINARIRLSLQRQVALADLLSELSEADTGQRGYLLTGDS